MAMMSRIETIAICHRAGKEHSRKWPCRVSDSRVVEWLNKIDGQTAHVRVLERVSMPNQTWVDHGTKRIDATA